ncbi:guanitoxin biosynthesis heme-dependent pre-guanitoxin N-hydroxylase GntA [Amycolatopsis panacis]|uniref:YqcI/YcgG family protein n=1 Tax=Amycolatopsis panacis TaxID=2340917 RepID=A0A419HWE1_9PSEU|nr:guanitoxin biosynthesis heme-dependent pre-guanitoxin N-hydroxylase GntA [Amycolatopsis panacis]RJQ81314.1 YqcI/YcgG family protein [Amycolatopsis panacis]
MEQNPFAPASGEAGRSYHGLHDGRFAKLWPQAGPPAPAAVLAHEAFRAMVLSEPYPCLVSRGVLRRGDYRFGAYAALGSAEAAQAAAADLWQFIHDFPIRADHFASFVASFDGPICADEAQFEQVLWSHLQLMHDADREHHEWNSGVGSDPNAKGFSFSFSGRAFFVVGMHPASSRWARRGARPTLVFNAHEQFDILRETGRMAPITGAIRARDREMQGHENPALRYFDGDHPETVMYSGRLPEDGWKCPLHIAPGAPVNP